MIDLKSLVSLPTYTTVIPSTGKKVSYRPFVVKEEKTLLIAKESGNLEQITNSVQEVMNSCFKEVLNIKEMPYFDSEFLFTQLRMKSMGEVVEIVVRDSATNEKFDTEMRLENIKIINLDKNKLSFDIKINDTFGVVMKYPPLTVFSGIQLNLTEFDSLYKVLAQCIDKIYTKDEVTLAKDIPIEQIEEFLQTLTKDMFTKIASFFKDMPKVIYEDEFVSPSTGNKIPIRIENFKDFFL